MTKRAKIAWLLTGLALLLGWWTLVPKLGKATEAEVRIRVAPELLQPLPHPADGSQRNAALRRILDQLPFQPAVKGRVPEPRDLTNPLVRSAVDILRQGALDRPPRSVSTQLQQYRWGFFDLDSPESGRLAHFANGLTKGALQAADRRDWPSVVEHMEAACLLLDRLSDSDATLTDWRWTLPVEAITHRATLALAARGDLPVQVAERLSACIDADRHTATRMLRVLQGEMQLVVLPQIGKMPLAGYYNYHAGTYEPLETTELLSARFIAMARDSGLSASRWSGDYPRVAQTFRVEPDFPGRFWRWGRSYSSYRDMLWQQLRWPVDRIRMNTARNSIGRFEAAAYLNGDLMAYMLRARSQRDQAAAALAVVRFRQRAGREPRDFAELVAAGLLRTAPMDHALDQPLRFDLQTLFKWPEIRTR